MKQTHKLQILPARQLRNSGVFIRQHTQIALDGEFVGGVGQAPKADRAGVGRNQIREDIDKGAFASTVSADEPEARTRFHDALYAVENGFIRILFGDAGDVKNIHRNYF